MSADERTFLTPAPKLAKFFRRSRDGWKQRCRAAKQRCRSLYNQVEVLKANRDRWKQETRRQRAEAQELRQQLAEQKMIHR